MAKGPQYPKCPKCSDTIRNVYYQRRVDGKQRHISAPYAFCAECDIMYKLNPTKVGEHY